MTSDLIGVDLEQFVRDPYATGVQRVLVELARNWPADVPVEFVVPMGTDPRDIGSAPAHFGLLTAEQATALISIPFGTYGQEGTPESLDLRFVVQAHLERVDPPRVAAADLPMRYTAWLLPEPSYLPAVLQRWTAMVAARLRSGMIAHDILPMSHPENYRLVPGTGGWASQYFRYVGAADFLICTSEVATNDVYTRLRHSSSKPILVAPLGGDHVPIRQGTPPDRPRFVRLGTLEGRKMPLEIVAGYRRALEQGLDAELVFIGNASASSAANNRAVQGAIDDGLPVTWIRKASDDEVQEQVTHASALLSLGVEGYGITVVEAIRLGCPVLYWGVQPTGTIMDGKGAQLIDGSSTEGISEMFLQYSQAAKLEQLRSQIDVSAVPRWSDFAHTVAQACAR